ncbi:hypothetical protein [Rhizobium leguminosarum]|uniref:Uncharacterized protein n=1 Tax=Rhizobium leguminosarum TaxID=384 RepID=A0ABD7PVC8_RHILE|nr:hypothetical protein [Rhizobium leguminosarum]TAV75141.1 hypothetical protein ELI28_17175 [Rhizobium leguminosarum]TAV79740.1 hypothetical protein ELI27_17160 [Rhizobium leguminosarum]TAW31076.1 hypothetical protein ELI19_16930 [Rhizobium leguminosarum]TAW44804.1 hypothetical protein ELI18_16885 [Rhizobium leguminosarum]TAX35962.1 hypothetical protein ELI06_17385 [Rhizobium leguminosarum]
MDLTTRIIIFSMQCRKLPFPITMKQCRCKLKKITCAPIIFLLMQIERRAEKRPPANLKGEKSIRPKLPPRRGKKPGATAVASGRITGRSTAHCGLLLFDSARHR